MQTFFIDQTAVRGDELYPGADVAHHIIHVLRMRVGEPLRFSDNQAYYYEGTIAEMTKKSVKVTVTNVIPINDEPKTEVTLIQCLPRGDKMEQILQKTTELGVKRVIPAESENSQVRLKDKKNEKQQRWQKIVAAAAEQCGRGIIPTVDLPCPLQEAVASLDKDTALVFCYEKEGNYSISQALKEIKGKTKKIALVIGPEGGFSDDEAQMIMAKDAYCVSLGKRILRTETAGMAVIAVVMYEFLEWEVVD